MLTKRRENYLKTVSDIQKIVRDHKKHGANAKWVYENVIDVPGSPYHFSYSTFCRYMTENAGQALLKNENLCKQ